MSTLTTRQAAVINEDSQPQAPLVGTHLRELGQRADALEAATGDVGDLDTDATDLVGAVNEVLDAANAAVKADVVTALDDLADDDDTLGVVRVARGVFDPSANAGQRTVAAHAFGPTIPNKAIILRTYYEVETTFQSATGDEATVALGIATDSAAGIKAAVAISNGGNPWDAGLHDGLQAGLAANMIKLAGARQFVATIAVEAVTAGKLVAFAEYVVGK